MVWGLKPWKKEGTERADPKSCDKQKNTHRNRYASNHVLHSCFCVSITSEARVPDGIMRPDNSHCVKILVSLIYRNVYWNVFDYFAIYFHVDSIWSDSAFSALKVESFYLFFPFAFLFVWIEFMLWVKSNGRWSKIVNCLLCCVYVRCVRVVLIQIRVTVSSRTYSWNTIRGWIVSWKWVFSVLYCICCCWL